MQSYRVAILGCRGRGSAAARAYAAHPRTEVVGLCDLVADHLTALGDELGVEARFDDLDEMIRQLEPDIVVIATGTEFHYDLAMRVLEQGVHIDIEKPMCTDLVQADAVMAKAREEGARVAVHHQGSVGAAMHGVSQVIDDGRIGALRYIWASGKGYYGGYGLMNIGTHLLNFICTLAGPCRGACAVASTGGRPIEPDDVIRAASGMGIVAGECITATLAFDGSLTATLAQHRLPKTDRTAFGVQLAGAAGRVQWRSSDAWWLPHPHFLPDGEHDDWQPLDLVDPPHFTSDSRASVDDYWFVEDYVQALDEGREHTCSGQAALHVIEIMMAIFESAAYGRRVALPQPNREHPLLRWRRENGLGEPGPLPRPYHEWLAAEDARMNGR